jgi:hypothetical protein
MARYMLSVHSVESDVREPPTREEMEHKLAATPRGRGRDEFDWRVGVFGAAARS